MPAILKTDIWDDDVLARLLVGYLDISHLIYPCALALMRAGNTMQSAVSTTTRLRSYFRYLHDKRIDPLLASRDDLETWMSSYRHLSPETLRSSLGTVRNLYEEAIDRGLIDRNPTRRLKVGRFTPAKPPALSLRDVENLLATIRLEIADPKTRLVGLRDNLIFSLLCTVGPRTSEILRITVVDIHLDDDRVTADTYGKNRKHDSKSLPPVVVEAVRLWMAALEEWLGRALRPEDALFIGLSYRSKAVVLADKQATLVPMTRTGFFGLIRSRLRDLGLQGPKAGPHRLRKTAATLAWQNGVDPAEISRMLGHEHLSQTMDAYIKPAMDLERSAADSTRLKPMEPGDD